jgi:hypothetical protein
MGASDLPLHVRQRIESKWSARVRREHLHRAAVAAEAVGGESCPMESLAQGDRAGDEPSSSASQGHRLAAADPLAPAKGDSTSA